MRRMITAALCDGTLAACSHHDGDRNPAATSGSSISPAATSTMPNDDRNLMRDDNPGNDDQGVKNSPSRR
jgi:hypothetical protein